ncbi:MAG: Pseudouridine synthase, partial [Candidatus Daviesbacteria bacterium GW2011_GWA1_36_8]
GDEKYAGRKTARLDHHWCPRQFLHAAKLEFDHPVTGERMVFESQLPSDLKKVLDVLGQLR